MRLFWNKDEITKHESCRPRGLRLPAGWRCKRYNSGARKCWLAGRDLLAVNWGYGPGFGRVL